MNLPARLAVLVLLFVLVPRHRAAADEQRDSYLEMAKAAYQQAVENCPSWIERWKERHVATVVTGHAPPGGPVVLARLAATLYHLTGEEHYAREAARWLANHHRFKEFLPDDIRRQRPDYKDGVPTVSDFFQLAWFCQAYAYIKDCPAVTGEQKERIAASVAESCDFMRFFPEWGAMNRAILRAEGLMIAAQALPEHPHAANWAKLARTIAADSWGHWSEEDAQIYHPIWLASLIGYADTVGDPSLYSLHTTRHYFEYFAHLLSPAGMVPDFGDARWNDNWAVYIACLERGAAEYGLPELRWAAGRILEARARDHDGAVDARSGFALADAYRWADGSIEPQQPPARSEEVLDDLVGKKIVFRDGWEDDATYLMLNYRDEGDYARLPRNYLRHTIPVEEEKAHHGHSDENSVCLLMAGGSVLLHDAGYRDYMPSGPYGAYRADYFHNRLVARPFKRGREQPLFEFLRNSGAYQPVRTEKIDFVTATEVDASRTRLTDERMGYQADRVIAWLKPDDVFVVFDIVKVTEPGYFTFATLWHGTTVLEEGSQHFVTAVDAIRHHELDRSHALLVHFPETGVRRTGSFPIKRSRQDETAVYQAVSSHYYTGGIQTLTTVLVPHRRGTDVAPLVENIRLLEVDGPRDGVGVRLDLGGQTRYVCVKTDLMKDIVMANTRPRYTYDAGRVRYGPFETDAAFLYARTAGDTVSYLATDMVKVVHQGTPLFESEINIQMKLPDDLSINHGPCKWRLWEDTVPVGQAWSWDR